MKRILIATLIGLMSLSYVAWAQEEVASDDAISTQKKESTATPTPAQSAPVQKAATCSEKSLRVDKKPQKNRSVELFVMTLDNEEDGGGTWEDSTESGPNVYRLKVVIEGRYTEIHTVNSSSTNICQLRKSILVGGSERSQATQRINDTISAFEKIEEKNKATQIAEEKARANCTSEDQTDKQKIACLADKGKPFDTQLKDITKDMSSESIKALFTDSELKSEKDDKLNPKVARALGIAAARSLNAEAAQELYKDVSDNSTFNYYMQNSHTMNDNQKRIARQLIEQQTLLKTRKLSEDMEELSTLSGVNTSALMGATSNGQSPLAIAKAGLTMSMYEGRLIDYSTLQSQQTLHTSGVLDQDRWGDIGFRSSLFELNRQRLLRGNGMGYDFLSNGLASPGSRVTDPISYEQLYGNSRLSMLGLNSGVLNGNNDPFDLGMNGYRRNRNYFDLGINNNGRSRYSEFNLTQNSGNPLYNNFNTRTRTGRGAPAVGTTGF